MTNTTRDESDGMRRRVRATSNLFCLSAVQAKKLPLSASLACAEGALKCPPAEHDGGAAIEVFSASSVFWVYPSVLVLFGRSCCLKNCDSEAPPPGYAVLWSVGVGTAGAPVAIRRGSRFIASVVVVDTDKPKQPTDCLGGVGPV